MDIGGRWFIRCGIKPEKLQRWIVLACTISVIKSLSSATQYALSPWRKDAAQIELSLIHLSHLRWEGVGVFFVVPLLFFVTRTYTSWGSFLLSGFSEIAPVEIHPFLVLCFMLLRSVTNI